MPPLGLGYIGAVLRTAGYPADLFDLAAERELSMTRLERAGFFGYDVYGFTAYTKCFSSALAVLAALRERNRHAIVVFGGPHASPSAEAVLAQYPDIDGVVCNEGELPMLELVRLLATGEPELTTIPNLVYREGDFEARRRGHVAPAASVIRRNPATYAVQDLDALPYPVRDYKLEPSRVSLCWERRQRPVREVHVSSSRGCPKRCTFCSIVVASPTYRVRSVDSLMEEISYLYGLQPFGHVYFVDANFAVSPKRTLAFARSLHAWRPDVTWSGTATADLIVRHGDEIVGEIGRLNCVRLEVGIESGSASQLARFNKRTSLHDNAEAIRLLHRADISLGLDFIMFDPEVTLRELRENIAFLFQAELWGTSPPACLFNSMRLYPGTPARDTYIRMFGLSSGHLDNIDPPFVDAAVAALYHLNQEYFATYQLALTDAVVLVQERWRALGLKPDAGPRAKRERQKLAALLIELQHEPYRFFDELLAGFEGGSLDVDSDVSALARMPGHARALTLLRRAASATNVTLVPTRAALA